VGNVTSLEEVPRATPDELRELADDVRILADEIEKGEILALTWVAHLVDDRFRPDWVKSGSVSKLELIGGVYVLAHKITMELLNDE
jgi:hypothetical protein